MAADDDNRKNSDSQRAMVALATALLVGLASVPVYAAHADGFKAFVSIVSVGILLAGASAFIGAVLGFLFGIPRTLQQETAPPPAPAENGAGASSAPPAPRRPDYRANTNLEQISDWLTKILVGVGLTQIPAIRGHLEAVTAFAAQGLGAQPHSQVYATALLSFSCVVGFLFGYLWTRLFLAGALRVADEAALGALEARVRTVSDRAASTERRLEELRKQTELDVNALNLANRVLNPSPDLPEVTQDALNEAVTLASRPIRVQIFNQAWQTRSDNWREAATKPKMERTIPIFRALIESDAEKQFHMNHGQLGFALKDRINPDWRAAEAELTTAIEMRGPWEEKGWLFYEFNRALCRISLDPDFLADKPSEPSRRQEILTDLRAATHAEQIKPLLRLDEKARTWLTLNGVSKKELES
jgi:hypothetical protein